MNQQVLRQPIVTTGCVVRSRSTAAANGANVMSKGMNRKKETKKKPAKTKDEKKAEKRAKKS